MTHPQPSPLSDDALETAWTHPPDDNTPVKYYPEHVHGILTHLNRYNSAPPLSTETPVNEPFTVMAYCHDIGKLTPWFQTRKINNPNTPSTVPDNKRSWNHSKLGAAATWYVLTELGYGTKTALTATTAVLQHHLRYPSLQVNVYKNFITNDHIWETVLQEQVTGISTVNTPVADWILQTTSNETVSWNDFATSIQTGALQDRLKDSLTVQDDNPLTVTTGLNREYESEAVYGDILRLWSLLTQTDTLDATYITSVPETPHPNTTLSTVDAHINSLPDATDTLHQEMNAARSTARSEVLTRIDTIPETDGVLSLALPTGMGKTLTGISAAIAYRNAHNLDGSLIYALPFTTIIDQTAEIISDVFNTTGTGEHFTVHHYLRETETPVNAADENANIEQLAGESWLTDITLTTFVQLFESLTGPTKRQSYKLPALHNSVIILDELQLLPTDWWPIISQLVEILTQQFNATVIKMTATQPALLKDHDPTTLITPADTPAIPSRVTYTLHPSLNTGAEKTGLNVEHAARELTNTITTGDSTLCICNTVQNVSDITHTVHEHLDADNTPTINLNNVIETVLQNNPDTTPLKPADRDDIITEIRDTIQNTPNAVIVAALTANIRPCDRTLILDLITTLKDAGTPVLTISTQLIEAGVDISFPHVYRDFAPLDSVVQTAGRCNRNYETGVTGGNVTLWQLSDLTGPPLPSEAVYNSQWDDTVNSLSIAYEALTEVCSLPDDDTIRVSESSMGKAVERYHELLDQRLPDHDYMVEALTTVDGETLGEKSMIEDNQTQFIVCLSEPEYNRVRKLRAAIDNREYSKAESLQLELQQIQVSTHLSESEEQNVSQCFDELSDQFDVFVVPPAETAYNLIGGVSL